MAHLRLKGHLPSITNDSIQAVSALGLDTEITVLPRGKPEESCHLQILNSEVVKELIKTGNNAHGASI